MDPIFIPHIIEAEPLSKKEKKALFKYPRTYHLPWSPGTTSDDRLLHDTEHFEGKEVVVTEKLDGENTSMYTDHIHARSLDSQHHASRNFVKSLHGQIKHDIPVGWRICGENVYACHSIKYNNLDEYFYVFGIYDDKNICLSWDETVEYAKLLGLITVPVLYRGIWDEEKIKACYTKISTASPPIPDEYPDSQEGYVVRVVNAFPYDSQDDGLSSMYTAKFVREKHVQTDAHWLEKPVDPNLLKTSPRPETKLVTISFGK
jgi:hypothetical protein